MLKNFSVDSRNSSTDVAGCYVVAFLWGYDGKHMGVICMACFSLGSSLLPMCPMPWGMDRASEGDTKLSSELTHPASDVRDSLDVKTSTESDSWASLVAALDWKLMGNA